MVWIEHALLFCRGAFEPACDPRLDAGRRDSDISSATMKPLRVLCFGAGYFSQFHLEAWNRIPEVQLVGLCDIDIEKAKSLAVQHGVPARIRTLHSALVDAKPDFVDVITGPDSHLSLVELAAKHRLPIICQKPLAPDFATAVKLVETAASRRCSTDGS